ncbi:MAG: hypothetical protein Q9160_006305 [Pyrenula sp. 1 TL-2023]
MAEPVSIKGSVSEEEKKGLERANDFKKLGTAYAIQQATRPSTIGFALQNSPIALLAWMGEKFLTWTDETPSLTTILEAVSLYWFIGCVATCMWPQRQIYTPGVPGVHENPAWRIPAGKPLGYSWFPREVAPTPRAWVETTVAPPQGKPEDDGGQLTINLDTQQSKTQTAFDALSYTWGDLSHTFAFICNDQELRIHHNLKVALPYLAKRQSSLPIWIDAICINQSDDAEKFAQIRLMHSIYSQASQVWVWLGCGPVDSREAIAILPRFVEMGKELKGQNREIFPHPTLESKGLPSLSSPIWPVVWQLLDNPWFCRLWIVQEASMARRIRVLHGSNEIDWNMLGDAIDVGSNVSYRLRDVDGRRLHRSSDNNHNVFLIRQVVQDSSSRVLWHDHLLRTLLLTLRSHNCSSPYDRVFAVLGFVGQDQLEQIGLDDDLALLDLYTRFGRFLLYSTGPSKSNWWTLFYLAEASKRLPGLPSWCPDFHALTSAGALPQNSLAQPIAFYRYRGHIPYFASRGTSFASQSSDIYELIVRGKIFDTVDQVYPEFPHASKFRVGNASVQEFSNMLLDVHVWEMAIAKAVLRGLLPPKHQKRPPSEHDRNENVRMKVTLDDYWRTLLGNLTNRTDYTLTSETFHQFRRGLDGWAEFIEKTGMNFDNMEHLRECAFGAADVLDMEEENKHNFQMIGRGTPCMRFLTDILTCLEHRRLFTTSQGRLGFGPKTTQEADVVCILNYACTAHILRQAKNEGTEKYKLLGEAYVHGMMTGEIEALDLEEQDIRLV